MDAQRAATARLGFRLFLGIDVLVLFTTFFALLQPGARPGFPSGRPPALGSAATAFLVFLAAWSWRGGRRFAACVLHLLAAIAIALWWRNAGMERGEGIFSGAVVALGWWLGLHLLGGFAAMLARRRAPATPLLDDFLLVLAPCAMAIHLVLFVVL